MNRKWFGLKMLLVALVLGYAHESYAVEQQDQAVAEQEGSQKIDLVAREIHVGVNADVTYHHDVESTVPQISLS